MMGNDTVAAAAQWVQNAVQCLCINSGDSNRNGISYAVLREFMRNAPPPPPSLQAMWEQRVWKLKDEPIEVYCLRCLANSCMDGSLLNMNRDNNINLSFLIDPHLDGPFSPKGESDSKKNGLEWHVVRVVALRLSPSSTDVIQQGWSATAGKFSSNTPGGSLRPVYCSRTHVVIQLASGRRFSAWAYGDVGSQLRIGAVLNTVAYPTHTDDQQTAYVLHNVEEFTASNMGIRMTDEGNFRSSNMINGIFSPISSLPIRLSFNQLVESYAPEISGQTLCKSLLLLVVVQTMYRALRCRYRQPLHLLLLGASRSGKSALLRVFLRLLGEHATLISAHVVHGQQRSLALSQAITATYPHVRQQLLLGGVVCGFDALVIDELSSSSSANHIEGLITGVTPINSGTAAPSFRGHVAHTQVQVTAAVNDDYAAAAAVVPQFSLVARTTAELSLRNTVSIGESVIAASVARSQSFSVTPSRSVSLCDSSPSWFTDKSVPQTGLLDSAFLRSIMEMAPSPSILEAAIPSDAFTRFYLNCLSEHWQNGSSSTTTLASRLSVLWELNLARLILENFSTCGVNSSTVEAVVKWNETIAAEVWQYYKHHLWAVDTAASSATGTTTTRGAASAGGGGRGGDKNGIQTSFCEGAAFPAARNGKMKKMSKKSICVALLRMMSREQRSRAEEYGMTAAIVPEECARAFFEQMGGEEVTGQSFSSVIQHLLDAALIIRRLNAYAVVAEA
ncbi:uncharacterized protein TM35_000371700 [Trypanosoma theileri]|uniref:Uncharacterized protein n=1 Tax=Trypanosoma theileri TaxID=67003 RepID=A0A1X0NKL2_9TRYP|nr:uncharacterized protein TM35_000371700 [Trypanosoma theileri]ORC85197.1 hypothetical protein TM35_000371700 [Trypanosoma theileri]